MRTCLFSLGIAALLPSALLAQTADEMAAVLFAKVPPSRAAAIAALKKLEPRKGKIVYFQPGDESVQKINNLPKLSENMVRALQWFPEVEDLSLTGHIEEMNDWVAYLKPLKNLHLLALDNKKLTDDGLKKLSELQFPKLTDLYIYNSAVTDDGMQYLKRLQTVRKLSLVDSGISDAGLEHLKALKNLEVLAIRGTKVTKAGAADLKKALPKCKVVGAK